MNRKAIHNLTRRGLLAGAAASLAAPVLGQGLLTSPRPVLRGGPRLPEADVLVREAGISGDVVFAVADATTGEVLEARGKDMPIAPASVTKAITALYALDVLGASHRFRTRLMATGPVTDGILDGNLILAGGCDPTLDTRDLALLAARLKEAGIREVRGGFVVHEGPVLSVRAIDPGQPDHVGYNPAVSGIALNFNRVHFEWKRVSGDYTITMDARTGKYRPDVDIARMSIADRGQPVYTYRDADGRDNWTVARGALGREGARWLPVRRPGLYAGEVFATLARSNGIVLKPPAVISILPPAKEVAAVESAPLSEVLQGMLKFSTNLSAEMVGLAATYARAGQVPTLAASAREMNRWAQENLGMVGPAFADHSGLGSASRISAVDMVRGLSALGHAELLRPLLKPVKLLDAAGRTTNNHPVKADAKTGTLNFVSGLAGYATATGGRELVFAIFSADEDIRASLTQDQRERPPGGRTWANRSRRLQRRLIMRWGSAFNERTVSANN
ncbi:D-alanyl-D-alanine carboxypeptidase/D-alanyl-D-alanine-endopeptidase [uncultured Roseobacter sp.]|uniref:D-alanyl-D-alanine carboxypeptidase/D-alanyl-D-alanine endopeptidase n=1 Tax=uncultured Roseobacter sp. TaxID=114847 RepID=UPI0026319F44|nr:D-alanyl-D-alanine carboxypeptidase/D-alanyl-D-alanine-endopeptidase [uncultured Roseobacter sp.]